MKTPIFYHPKKKVGHNFISVQKIPEFVRQSKRETLTFEPFKREDFLLAHSPKFVDEVLSCKIPNGFGTRDFEIKKNVTTGLKITDFDVGFFQYR